MNKTQVVTLRVPVELKARLEYQAKNQGVSLNNLANYFLTTQLSQVEAVTKIDQRISSKNLSELKSKVTKMLDSTPHNRDIPSWDRIQ